MKKILPVLLFCGVVVAAGAQPLPYTFSVLNQEYVSLSEPTSLSGGEIWDDPDWEVPIGFDFQYMGGTYSTLTFGGVDSYGGELIFGTYSDPEPYQVILPYGLDLIDGGDLTGGEADSPVGYSLTGVPGSRVFTLEWSNSAFYNEDGPATMRINFQMRLYEGTNDIEFHYGPRANLDNGVIQDYDGIVIGLARDFNSTDYLFDPIWTFTGDPQNPDVQTHTDYNVFEVATFLSDTPSNGTVYHFDTGLVSVSEMDESDVSVYPTLVNEQFNVVVPGNERGFLQVHDVRGGLIAQTNLQPGYQQISAASWSAGTYVVSIVLPGKVVTKRIVRR